MNDYFSSWLRKKLIERGMKQKDIAEALDISDTAVSHYVNGSWVPTIPNLVRLCDALDEPDIGMVARLICLDDINKMQRKVS